MHNQFPPIHYAQRTLSGQRRLPCNGRHPGPKQSTTPVLDNITCPACIIALAHQAKTALKAQVSHIPGPNSPY